MGHIAHLRKQTVQINKHIWLSWCKLREEKNTLFTHKNWIVLHLNKLESPSPKDALCQIWPSGSGEEEFLISWMYFAKFRNYLHFEKGGALHLNKLESSSPKDALWTSDSWEEDFLISTMYFRYLVIIHTPSFEQTWIPFTQRCV